MIKAGRERDAGILVCSQHSGWGLRCSDRGAGVRPDIGVVIRRCRNGTCGGAWVGWMQAQIGAVSGVVCQIRIVGSVQFPPITRIKSLRTPNKSGLWPEVNGWWDLAQSST